MCSTECRSSFELIFTFCLVLIVLIIYNHLNISYDICCVVGFIVFAWFLIQLLYAVLYIYCANVKKGIINSGLCAVMVESACRLVLAVWIHDYCLLCTVNHRL